MKRILVPTDFSDCAEVASEVAMTIATKTKCEIYFLHLHTPQPDGGHMAMHGNESPNGHYHHDCTGYARAKLDELVKKAEHQNISAKPVLVLSENREQIVEHIRAFLIDFVVMGSHGSRGLKEVFAGTNAAYLAKKCDLPILIVKKQTDFNPQKIVLTSAFFDKEDHQLTEFINYFAPLWNSHVYLLFVNTSGDSEESEKANANMKQYSQKLNIIAHLSNYASSDEESGIRKFADETNADLIVVARSFKTKSILSSNISKRLLNHEDRPVLIF